MKKHNGSYQKKYEKAYENTQLGLVKRS